MSVENFISQFCQWGYNGGLPKESARRLSTILRKIIYKELPERDELVHVWIRDLINSNGLGCNFTIDDLWCKSQNKDFLLAGVTVPYWRRGFRQICKDDYVYDSVSTFFHFASQYVGRSKLVNLIGAIALTYNRACDFRGHKFSELVCRSNSDAINSQMTEYFSDIQHNPRGREKILISWCERINSLDPYINRMIFNYIRALELFDKGFSEESIAALDGTVNVAEQFVRERMGIHEKQPRVAVIKAFGLKDKVVIDLEFLYNLRCYFGAHPSLSKWWDFGEIYEHDFSKLFDLCKIIIYHTCKAEEKYRIVERNPTSWANWFNENAMTLWKAVWFEKIPR